MVVVCKRNSASLGVSQENLRRIFTPLLVLRCLRSLGVSRFSESREVPPTASFLSVKIFCLKGQRTESIITPVFVVINYDCGVCLRVPSCSRGILRTLAAPKSSMLLSPCSSRTNSTTIFRCFVTKITLPLFRSRIWTYNNIRNFL